MTINLSLILPMATFALVASISPGPVNIIGLSTGARYSLTKGLVFITGATLGFTLLFLAIGFGLSSLLVVFPAFEYWLTWAGIIFLLYLSYRLAIDDGNIKKEVTESSIDSKDRGNANKPPGFFTGFVMQWLNPKAWIASAASISAYTDAGNLVQIWVFAALYIPICWLSLSCWVSAGAYLRHRVHNPKMMRVINRVLALVLVVSCLFLIFEQ